MYSKTTLIGNLTKDADHVAPQNGGKTSRALVQVATDTFWYANGERKRKTDFHRVVAFGPQADRIRDLEKGQQVFVEGRNQTRQFEKDGETRYITEIVAERVERLGPNRSKNPSEPDASDS